MADERSRKSGEHNAQLIALKADNAALRDRVAALEARVARLEASVSIEGKKASKRPPVGPPPLPRTSISMPASKTAGRRSIVDISDIAELVESVPPPAPAPPRPRK